MGIRRRGRVRRLDDVVGVLEAVGDPLEGVGACEAQDTEDGCVRGEAAGSPGIAADRGLHEALQAVRGDLFAHDERA